MTAATARVAKELDCLPAQSLPFSVHVQVLELKHNIRQHFEDGLPDFPLRKNWYTLARAFRKGLADSRPALILPSIRRPIGAIPRADHDPASIVIDSDDEDMSGSGMPAEQAGAGEEHTFEPPTGSICRGGQLPDQISPHDQGRDASLPPCTAQVSAAVDNRARFSFEAIRDIISTASVGLPGHTDPKAIVQMHRASVQPWDRLTVDFLDQTERLCRRTVVAEIEKNLGQWKETPLYDRVTRICRDFLLEGMAEQKAAAKHQHGMAMQDPMTLNEEALVQAQKKALIGLRMARRVNRQACHVARLEAQNRKPLSDSAFKDRMSKVTDDQLGVDPFDQELETMAVSGAGRGSTVGMELTCCRPCVDTTLVPTFNSWTIYVEVSSANSSPPVATIFHEG